MVRGCGSALILCGSRYSSVFPNSGLNPGFWWPKIEEKIYSYKTFIYFLDRKITQRTHKLQEKLSALKGEHPALQNMKILYLLFSKFVGHSCPPGSGSTTLVIVHCFYFLLLTWIGSAVTVYGYTLYVNANTTKQWTGLLFCWTGIYYRTLHRLDLQNFRIRILRLKIPHFPAKKCKTDCDNCTFCKNLFYCAFKRLLFFWGGKI